MVDVPFGVAFPVPFIPCLPTSLWSSAVTSGTSGHSRVPPPNLQIDIASSVDSDTESLRQYAKESGPDGVIKRQALISPVCGSAAPAQPREIDVMDVRFQNSRAFDWVTPLCPQGLVVLDRFVLKSKIPDSTHRWFAEHIKSKKQVVAIFFDTSEAVRFNRSDGCPSSPFPSSKPTAHPQEGRHRGCWWDSKVKWLGKQLSGVPSTPTLWAV